MWWGSFILRGMRVAGALLLASGVSAAAATWESRGPGGGGAFFGPAINPHRPSEFHVASDMGEAYVSTNAGQSWRTVDFRTRGGGSLMHGCVQFTPDPAIQYALSGHMPKKSTDGGRTWTPIPHDPWSSSYYSLIVDDQSTTRLLISDYQTIRLSLDGGATYATKHSAPDNHVAGAFFHGNTIYIGTRAGMLLSSNGGATFSMAGYPGLPADEELVSFAGAVSGGTVRLFCVTHAKGSVWSGKPGYEYYDYRGVYRLDPAPGAAWVRVTTGLATDRPFFVSMARNNISTAYLAGATDYPDYPVVYKTTNGGASWQKVFHVNNNFNIATGWQGDDPGSWNWRKWSYGGCALSFAVCPTDPARALITDFGFVHATEDGGLTWRQTYVQPQYQNAMNAPTDKTKPYAGNGLEDSVSFWLVWADAQSLFAGCTDIRGLRSADGGRTWNFPPSLSYNGTYQTILHPNGKLYAAASSVHDIYEWDRYLQDSALDAGSGALLVSADKGASWQVLKDFGKPLVGVTVHPNNPEQVFVCLVNRTSGGIYRTSNVSAGAGATWTKLGVPPRTEGHPQGLAVLADGTLVAWYSARISGDFTASSGVFVSTDGGAYWQDRSATGMRYYTRDVVIDPHDPAQQTWYAGVWGEWGNSSGHGGLYRTTNRGATWTRISSGIAQVTMCAINPTNRNEAFITTETQGLWHTANLTAATPTFTGVAEFPFAHPTRAFFNPHDARELWVCTYGNGFWVRREDGPPPPPAPSPLPENDFDGDGQTDFATMNRTTGAWTIRHADGHMRAFTLGASGSLPAPGDYDGDDVSDPAVFEPAGGNWRILRSSDAPGAPAFVQQWGSADAWPVPADYDGDRRTDVAIFAPGAGHWYVRASSNTALFANPPITLGSASSDPVPGDYDGDGRADLAVYARNTGLWTIRYTAGGTRSLSWGNATTLAAPADYDGDGTTDVAVYHPASRAWFIEQSRTRTLRKVSNAGAAGTVIAPGDYDGDGMCDPGVFHRATANWYYLGSAAGNAARGPFACGSVTDIPACAMTAVP